MQHAAMPMFMIAAVWAARRASVLRAQRLGLIVQCAAYAMLGMFAFAAERVSVPAAVLIGAASACYYISYTPMMLAYTSNDGRDAALGALNLINTLIGLLAPVLTGFVISGFAGLNGYRLLFFISAFISLACLAQSYRLDPIGSQGMGCSPAQPEGGARTYFVETARAMASDPLACAAMLATFAYASRFALFTYFGSLLGYAALGSESSMGVTGLIGGIVAMCASFAYGKYVKPLSRGGVMIGAAMLLIAGVALIAFRLNVWTWIAYTVCVSSTTVFLDAPPLAAHLAVVNRSAALERAAPEVTTIREFVYGAGYAISFIPVMLTRDPSSRAAAILLAAAALQIVPAICVRYISKKIS
jgi:YQGE family putative transporter